MTSQEALPWTVRRRPDGAARSQLPEPMQEVDERAYPPARQPTQSVPTGRAPQLGQKAAPYLPLDARRSAPVRQDAPGILIQRMSARGLATVENVQRTLNIFEGLNLKLILTSWELATPRYSV